MKAWSMMLALVANLVGLAWTLHDFHIDKSKDLFVGYGVGFKYPSEVLLLSKKLIKRKGLVSSNYKLISRSEYDLIMTLKVNGTFRGKTDGVLINLSPDNVMQKISYYEPSDARDFGFINKLFGLVIAVRQSPKSQGNNTHNAFNVYARFFENQIKVKDNQLPKILNMETANFSKEFLIERDNSQFDIIVRYQDNVAKVFVKPTPSQPPVLVYMTEKAAAIRSYFLSFAASSTETYVGVSLPSVYFKSDLQNPDVTYFENHDFQERTEVFNYIHYMHEVINEDFFGSMKEIDVEKINDEEILTTMIDSQRSTLDHMRPVNSIMTAAEQEITSIFTYLDTYRNLSQDYFVKIVTKVDKMLATSNEQFSVLAKDIDKISAKLNNGKLVQVANKAHNQMKATVEELKRFDSKLKKASDEVQKLNDQIAEGSKFFEKYETLLNELPDSIRQELDQVTQNNSNIFATIGKAIGYLVLLAAVIGFLAICMSLGGSGSKSRSSL